MSCITTLQVLEGYVYLGNVASLGEEVMAAFASVIGAAALKVHPPSILFKRQCSSHVPY